MQEKLAEQRIRCNNTHCECYNYGSCSSDKLMVTWDDKRKVMKFKCDFN